MCKVNDDGFYFVDIFERCPIKYYVHFSEDGGKTWWNSGGGRGDGTGFIQKLGENDIEKEKKHKHPQNVVLYFQFLSF